MQQRTQSVPGRPDGARGAGAIFRAAQRSRSAYKRGASTRARKRCPRAGVIRGERPSNAIRCARCSKRMMGAARNSSREQAAYGGACVRAAPRRANDVFQAYARGTRETVVPCARWRNARRDARVCASSVWRKDRRGCKPATAAPPAKRWSQRGKRKECRNRAQADVLRGPSDAACASDGRVGTNEAAAYAIA